MIEMNIDSLAAESVKLALTTGSTSHSIVASLRSLLNHQNARAPRSAGRVKAVKPSNSAISGPNNPVSQKSIARSHVSILEDTTSPLSAKEKYVLATEVVNIALTTLTTASKSVLGQSLDKNSSPSTKSRATSTISSPTQRPLKPRSDNATPVSRPTSKSKLQSCGPAKKLVPTTTSHLTATAECARIAFAYLRSANVSRLGIKEIPKWQLENGMLALAGRLVTLGLYTRAIEELRIVKLSFHEAVSVKANISPAAASIGSPYEVSPDNEMVTTLLHLDDRIIEFSELLPLVVTYQHLVLKIISLSRNPALIEAAVAGLLLERASSPANIIRKQANASKDISKTSKQLESLAQLILSLCPSISPSADSAACSESCPSPAAVFELQTLALQIRQSWWGLADHQVNFSKELLSPFAKCLAAFVRRSAMVCPKSQAYQVSQTMYHRLRLDALLEHEEFAFDLLHNMASLARRTASLKDQIVWVERMEQASKQLDMQHARKLLTLVQVLAINVRDPEKDLNDPEINNKFDTTIKFLGGQLTGHAPDYEQLLESLHELCEALLAKEAHIGHAQRIFQLAASFAQRYSRSYPQRKTNLVLSIILNALKVGKTSEEIDKWISKDAASVLIEAGTLQSILAVANSKSLSVAWSVSSNAAALERILRRLLLRSLRFWRSEGTPVSMFDDENLQPLERAVLLECQLLHAAELANTSKYHDALSHPISDALLTLSKVYAPDRHPLRRIRVALVVLRLRERSTSLIRPQVAQMWHDTSAAKGDCLANDKSLMAYLKCLNASLALSQSFRDGRPSAEDLKPALLAWQDLIDGIDSLETLNDCIDDTGAAKYQLEYIASFLAAIGDSATRLPLLRLILQLCQLAKRSPNEICLASSELASQYLDLGYSEKAGHVLAQMNDPGEGSEISTSARLRLSLARAEYQLAIEDMESIPASLEEAEALYMASAHGDIPKDGRRTIEICLARGWFIWSRYCHYKGQRQNALNAAKNSVKLLNNMWAAIEKMAGETVADASHRKFESELPDVQRVITGVSKLQLDRNQDNRRERCQQLTGHGATYWPLIPTLCQSLLHLSYLFSHHGIFGDADYYSQRAIDVAKAGNANGLLCRAACHRGSLLVTAGNLEEAELLLSRIEDLDKMSNPLLNVEQNCVRAGLRAMEGQFKDSLHFYDQAIQLVDRIAKPGFLSKLESFREACQNPVKSTRASKAPNLHNRRPRINTRQVQSGKNLSDPAILKSTSTRRAKSSQSEVTQASERPSLLFKMMSSIMLEKGLVALRLGIDVDAEVSHAKSLFFSRTSNLRQHQLQFQSIMQSADQALQSDLSYNILPESTLSFPAIIHSGEELWRVDKPTLASAKQHRKAPTAKLCIQKPGEMENFASIWLKAKNCLPSDGLFENFSTMEAYAYCSMMSRATMLLSTTKLGLREPTISPIDQARNIELPKIYAFRSNEMVLLGDLISGVQRERLDWPALELPTVKSFTASTEFQAEYIDILPESWTAVSLSLNEDRNELFAARYRKSQQPLTLKLPFARHRQDDEEQNAFDYEMGKAELQEIIMLSNKSCHIGGNMEAKGAKSKWWSEREALDRRLQELLMNIENIWLGGFKSIFSLGKWDVDSFARFRKTFEEILARHLPSRKAGKTRSKHLELHDNVLELFLGHGDEQDGVANLDELLADLLYFVVDMLQFHGERNAYDEIDFDSMVVDVLDALRSFYETAVADHSEQHLILILDKRLLAFPWESLPCLEGVSVSRMGNMLSLRKQILSMHNQSKRTSQTYDHYVIDRNSGTYILNPSGDLLNTEKTLSLPLARLAASKGSTWSGIVQKSPSEDEFSTALVKSEMLLYFGHGSGAQYIRPRRIKKLKRCSAVVWLMGCSSGAVTEYGELEPFAVPLTYLMAGEKDTYVYDTEEESGVADRKCMAVVATLWDVTDKDIDRFSLAMGEEWGLFPPSELSSLPVKTTRKQTKPIIPATPRQANKMSKTSKTKISADIIEDRTPGCSRPSAGKKCQTSLVEAVARSRNACYLKYLNGAAPVVYGVPVYLGDNKP